MGRGRAPCCDKSQVKRGPWSPSEDIRLIAYIQKFGHDNWRSLPRLAGLLRCGKSCRLRWINYLRPDVKRGNFTKEEEDTIIRLHESIGNKWSRIAAHLPGRTDNEIKNVWNTYLKKRTLALATNDSSSAASPSASSSSSSSASFVDSATDNNASKTPSGGLIIGQDNCPRQVKEPVPHPSHNTQESQKQDQSTSSGSYGSTNSSQESSFACDPDQVMKDPDPGDCPKNVLGEVNKPHQSISNVMEMEIPLEFDDDFWNLFDNLEPIPLHLRGTDVHPSTCQVKACGIGGWAEEYLGEADTDQNRNWLRRVEGEFGRDGTGEEGDIPS